MDRRWKIELLGGLQARQGDQVVMHFRTQKTGLLLAYLAYYQQRSHTREELIELFWPECHPSAGRQSFRTALSSLRRQMELAPPGAGLPALPVFVVDRTAVQLNPAAVTTDVAEFERELRTAARADSKNERALRLAHAVELYRGDLLPGQFEAWILQERCWLAEAYFGALSQLLAHCQEEGDFELAFQYAQRGVTADPLREDAHCDLIRLHTAAGQTSTALRQYRELERSLRTLGASPGAEARALPSDFGRADGGLPKATRLSSQEVAFVGRLVGALVKLLLNGMNPPEDAPP